MTIDNRLADAVLRIARDVLTDEGVTLETPLEERNLASLAATRISISVQRELGAAVDPLQVRSCRDLRELVSRVAVARPAEPIAELAQCPGERFEPFGLTPLQQAYRVGTQAEMTRDPAGCVLYREFVEEELDVDRLRQAWQRLVDHHEALRLVFTAAGEQRVLERVPDWTLSEPANMHLDAEWPRFAIAISRRENGTSVVHLAIDGALTDGHGLALLLEQWRACYGDPDAVLPAAPFSLRDAVRMLGEPPRTADLEYWLRRLANLPGPPALRYRDVSSPPRQAFDQWLATDLRAELEKRAAVRQVSTTSLLLTLFAETLQRHGAAAPFTIILTTSNRVWLPAEASRIPGPFAAAMPFIVDAAPDATLDEAIARTHAALWSDIAHATVDGVAALREHAHRTRSTQRFPVVFTSLLGTGAVMPRLAAARSQTSDVVLDHQLWEEAGGIRIHWDIATAALPPGAAETLFASFVTSLYALCDSQSTRRLNDLQQAYAVARACDGGREWNGCQVYQTFRMRNLDAARVERTWLRMVGAYDVLRTTISADGQAVVRHGVPERMPIPVIDLRHFDASDAASARARIEEEMVARAFPLGRWPMFDLRVTRDEDGLDTLHCAIDLAIADGVSLHFLARELLRLYADASAQPRKPKPLDELPPAEVPTAYWQERFESMPAGPPLRIADGSRRRTRREGSLGEWHRVEAWCAAHGVEPDDALLALAMNAIGDTLGIGVFSMPVVRWVAEAAPFRPAELTVLTWATRADRELSLAKQAAAYRAQRAADPPPLTGSGLAELRKRMMRRRREGAVALPVVYTSILPLRDFPLPSGITAGRWMTCTPDVSLDCIAAEDGEGLRYFWDSVDADFPEGAAARMFAAFERALHGLVERQKVLYEWNDTAVPVLDKRPVHLAFELAAAAVPDAVAVRYAEGAITFATLNEHANRIAWRLRETGVAAESLVGICMRRTPAMVAAVFGVLKAGGAYVPLDPALPAERIALLIADSGARVVLTIDGALPLIEGVDVIDIAPLLHDEGLPATNPDPNTTAASTAYVIFTSGSTGKPKGVDVAHRAVANLLQWCNRTFDFGPHDLGLAVASLSFDLSVFDLFGLLGRGAGIYLANEAEQKDPALLLDILLREPVTFWNSAPIVLHQLMPLLPAVTADSGTRSLRLVFLSGDYTPLSLPDALRSTFPNARVISLGGATEATVWSNWFEVTTVDPAWRSIPYGRPIDNVRYYILDERLEPCPAGVEGDLFIGGLCLANGYHRRSDLTAERFIVDPFALEPGQRMYRTGDRASFFPDGNICFLGRSDAQVKIRGFRVELGEIEHRLRQHTDVADAYVRAVAQPGGDRVLAAYVERKTGAALTSKEVRAHAAAALPEYMVPNFVAFVDRFPSTSNGKLDRNALPWPFEEERPAFVAAPLRDEISEIVAQLLGRQRVDADEDLWDQGATSFTMVQLSAALHERYGRRLRVATLLAEPSVAAIARQLGSERGVDIAPAETVDFFSREERDRFKGARMNLRANEAPTIMPLALASFAPEQYAWRSTRREFLREPVSHENFSRFLGLLRAENSKFLYPSAGSTYAVQTYVHVRPGGVENVAPGLYYYQPHEHALHLLDAASADGRERHFQFNRPVFDSAAFELFLVGQLRGIRPLYGDDSERFLLLEAGYIGQLLMMGQASCGIGLCPVGTMNFDDVAARLALDGDHRFLHAFLGGASEHPRAASGELPAFASPRREPLAITGIAGRYAGADDPDALWRTLREGSRNLRPVPPARGFGPEANIAGGYLDGIDRFDSLLFDLSPREARTLDPQLRLALESVWACLENAGVTALSLNRTAPRVGVFVAAMWSDYQLAASDAARAGAVAMVSASSSDIANRISHFFGFRGPSVAVNTSCASSLTALHLAAESLRRGECDAAIVAAANVIAHPYHVRMLRDLNLLATTGDGRAFDGNGSGWIPGEGSGAILLRRADDAARDGAFVHALVKATSIGHAGGDVRFGAPNAAALRDSIARTLDVAGLHAGDLDYVECAAAGASISDAAEVEALREICARDSRRTPLAAGTMKPNIGHLESAAGLAQLTKVVLQLRERQLAPTVAAERGTSLIDWSDPTVSIVRERRPWTGRGDAPLRALINAIGATGSYAHAIVTAPPPRAAAQDDGRPHAVIVSAATREQLQSAIDRLYAHLAALHAREAAPSLASIAFTLQTGRVAMAHRFGAVCRSIEELLGVLAAGRRGEAEASSESDLLAEWLDGRDVDWERCWNAHPARVPLPTYPFAQETHWLNAPRANVRLEQRLAEIYAEVSGIPAARISPHTPLEHYGLNSWLVSELNERLRTEFGTVSRTLFFEARDLAGVAAALARNGELETPRAEVRVSSIDEPIAIVGIAGRYPDAPALDDFWRNLAGGRDSITPMPEWRRRDGWPSGLMWGSFLADIDRFDPLFFRISPRDAARMDPQERIFLEVVWETLENAGYPPVRLRERHQSRVGVFAASMYNEYPYFGLEQNRPCGSALAGIANRASYFLDLRGPSLTVDTMCSGSLTAIHLAVESLRRGECEAAIAGGVNLSLHPNKFLQAAELQMTSSDHRCRSFGVGGDGFVAGEGAGAVLLKTLRAALAGGDRIHAVIRGTAVNHGGRTNGYMVPNPVAQGELVAEALRRADVDAGTITYVEAHGTGTELGDPVEWNGLMRAWNGAAAPRSCVIGSVKSNIGHLEAAAGIAGLTKVVLQMQHGELAPSLHAGELNPNIDWSRSPFVVQTASAPWTADGPRRAGVSSFGAGGANAHVILEEHRRAPASSSAVPREELIVLSARDEERLRIMAGRLAAHLRRQPERLDDVAYTLRVGREPLRERLAFVASTLEEACTRLEAIARGGAIDRHDGPSPPELPRDRQPVIVSLPAYPFARVRCWVSDAADETPLYRKMWVAGDAAADVRTLTDRIVCIHGPDSAQFAREIAARGTNIILIDERDLARVDTLAFDGIIDLCDDRNWREHAAMLQRVLRRNAPLRLLHVTRGLAELDGAPPSLVGARLAGIVRMLAAESSRVRATHVDVDADAARCIAAEWLAADGAFEVCYRGGRRHLPRLAPIDAPADAPRLDPDRTYVISGATGGIGRLVTQHLIERGARHLALLGATRIPDLADALVYTGSLTDRDRLGAFLRNVRAPIGGVVHCAGLAAESVAPFAAKDLAAIDRAFEPKADGLAVLAELCASDNLAFFVICSSISAVAPALAAGVVEYATANAFADSFAIHQRRRGSSAFRSINWPVWREAGMGRAHPDVGARAGLASLSNDEALRVLDRAIAVSGVPQLIVAPPLTETFDPQSLLERPLPAAASAGVDSATAPPPPWLVTLFSKALQIPERDLDPSIPFGDLGVESVLLASLLREIESHVGRPLEPSLLLDHPTLGSLAACLAQTAPQPVVTIAAEREVAVIGLACRFPGAPDAETFWSNLAAARHAITEVPPSRWDAARLYQPVRGIGTSISRWGGFVDGVEDFDPDAFGMTEAEAIALDPAIRMFLEGATTTFRDAGYADDELRGRAIGIFTGARMSDYRRRSGVQHRTSVLGGDQNFIAARVAHQFDLRGPCLVVDSACSSALLAVHLAMQSVLRGECELALAGGVEVLLDEQPYLEFTAAGALSPSGRCATFDRDADGFVPGEGCGVVLLKRLDLALRDGDRIHAVLNASAANNDGRTMGLTTPNPAAQTEVVQSALAAAGLRADEIGLVEAHGTATMIGDPIEVRALTDAFRASTARNGFCAIGSVKSNIGHLLSAAGIAGLLKIVLALEHRQIPPTLFCAMPNPRFDFESSPFRVATELREWHTAGLRHAAVSAFGLGGTNVHVISGEPDPALSHRVTRGPLPPPRFRRRRLWLEREQPQSHKASPSATPQRTPAVASLLDFQLIPASARTE